MCRIQIVATYVEMAYVLHARVAHEDALEAVDGLLPDFVVRNITNDVTQSVCAPM